jgi:hypothetical protein
MSIIVMTPTQNEIIKKDLENFQQLLYIQIFINFDSQVGQDEESFFNEDREFVRRLRHNHALNHPFKISIENNENNADKTDEAVGADAADGTDAKIKVNIQLE